MSQILSFPASPGRDGSSRSFDPAQSTFSEVWSASPDGGAAAFVMAALRTAGRAREQAGDTVLWVQDRMTGRETGRPYAPALKGRVIHVSASRIADLLMTMEAGLGCSALLGVVGEVWGPAPRVDFTATKRLKLRAEAKGVPCWLIRRGATPGLSAARDRWRVSSLASEADPWDPAAPGRPRWRAELFRSRTARTGTWVAGLDAADRLRVAAMPGDGALEEMPPERRRILR